MVDLSEETLQDVEVQRFLTEIQPTLDDLAAKLGRRYPGTLRAFQQFAKGRVYTSLWACRRQFVKYHGAYPDDYLDRLYAFFEMPTNAKVTHLFSGTVKPRSASETTVDLNPEVHPTLIEDAQHTSLPDRSQDFVFADRDYDEENAKVHNFPLVGPKAVTMECHRLTKPGGFYVMLDWLVSVNYAQDKRVGVIAITEGSNMRIRVANVFQRVSKEREA